MTADKLSVHGLELWGRVGCTEAERAFPQRLEMDVVLEMSLAEVGRTDDLSESVDYAQVVERLKALLEPREFRLVETVAEVAADFVIRAFKIDGVTVRVRKRALPGIAWAEVEIHRP